MSYKKQHSAQAQAAALYFELEPNAQTDGIFGEGKDLKKALRELSSICKSQKAYSFEIPIMAGPYKFSDKSDDCAKSLDVVDCIYFTPALHSFFEKNNRNQRDGLSFDDVLGVGQAAGRLAFEAYAQAQYKLNDIDVSRYGINTNADNGREVACQFVVEKRPEHNDHVIFKKRDKNPVTSIDQLLRADNDAYREDIQRNRAGFRKALDEFFGMDEREEQEPEEEAPGLWNALTEFRLGHQKMTGRRIGIGAVGYRHENKCLVLGVKLKQVKALVS